MTGRTPAGTDATPPIADLTEEPLPRVKEKRPTERTALRELERAQFAEIDRTLGD